MALVDVISKDLERDLRLMVQQITQTAATAQVLMLNLDRDRAALMAKLERVVLAAGEKS